MTLSSKTYDRMKWFTLIFLPALVTFAGVVMNALDFAYTDVTLTILVAFQTFLGSILGISNYNYNKG